MYVLLNVSVSFPRLVHMRAERPSQEPLFTLCSLYLSIDHPTHSLLYTVIRLTRTCQAAIRPANYRLPRLSSRDICTPRDPHHTLRADGSPNTPSSRRNMAVHAPHPTLAHWINRGGCMMEYRSAWPPWRSAWVTTQTEKEKRPVAMEVSRARIYIHCICIARQYEHSF
ncbi:hypothetical protein BD414DRAFT_315996 [Trametes punicea]|nr:hypothetical protein BD414DRAFT_315996 [Trametes punicea]